METTSLLIIVMLMLCLVSMSVGAFIYNTRFCNNKLKSGLIIRYNTQDEEIMNLLLKVQKLVDLWQPQACKIAKTGLTKLINDIKQGGPNPQMDCNELYAMVDKASATPLSSYGISNVDQQAVTITSDISKDIIAIVCKDGKADQLEVLQVMDRVLFAFCGK